MTTTSNPNLLAMLLGTLDGCLNVGHVQWYDDDLRFWGVGGCKPEVLYGKIQDGRI